MLGNVHINLSLSRNINEIGEFKLVKIVRFLKLIVFAFKIGLKRGLKKVYFSHTIRSAGFYRDLPVLLILRFFGCRIIYHLHNSSSRFDRMSSILFKGLYKGSDVVFLADTLVNSRFYTVAGKVSVIHNFSDFGGLGIQSRTSLTNIIYVANLHLFKGYELLLEVCDELDKRGLGFELNIFGADGELTTDSINFYVSSYKSMKVRAWGEVSREELLKQYLKADIVMLFSMDEALPLCLVEGMSLGLPIIATDIGGVSELVENEFNGFIVGRNSLEIVEKIQLLISNPNLLRKFSEAAFSKYEGFFSKEVYFQKFNQIFKD